MSITRANQENEWGDTKSDSENNSPNKPTPETSPSQKKKTLSPKELVKTELCSEPND